MKFPAPVTLMTVDQVSDLVGVTTNTLRYWRYQGIGPHSARIGRRVMYRESDVLAWLDEAFESGVSK